jgi:nucleotide-binding universal stress UspA family protein
MKILIAVDTTDATHQATLAAQKLFPTADHIIISAAAIAPYIVADPFGGGAFTTAPSIDAMSMAEDEADDAIDSAREVLGDKPKASVAIGDPGQVICDQAVDLQVDAIVVGRRSGSWLSHLFDPSVSEYVIKHAPCPVVVVREHTIGHDSTDGERKDGDKAEGV